MATAPTVPAKEDENAPSARSKPDAVGERVLAALGRPPELFRVAVVPLWGSRYRVNVITGSDPSSVRIPHSFFVEVGADGAITAATPPIVRQYP
jgi:hypothetical protein